MVRLLFLLHRYLGIAVGFVLLLWCLSGFVMMYVHYPEMTRASKNRGLAPLNLRGCCRLQETSWLTQANFDAITIEMLHDSTPVLRASISGIPPVTVDLLNGEELQGIGAGVATQIANSFARHSIIDASNDTPEFIRSDQWTVTGAYDQHRPFFLFRADDESRTEWYISSVTGEVVLTTTGSQRVWNYFGAVLHWLYPAVLRQHSVLWAQSVIWLSVAGVFLTLTGLYVGLRQFRGWGVVCPSPYSGVTLLHHYTGLICGVVLLLWVGSGLLSMNPWGLLEGESASTEVHALRGNPIVWSDVVEAVDRLSELPADPTTVRIELIRSAGSIAIISTARNGVRTRFDGASFLVAPLAEDDLKGFAALMLAPAPVLEAGLLSTGDAYYYEHHSDREFPVYRVIADDDEQRRYYLSATTGELIVKVDNGNRWYRWLVNGLHRGDFIPLLRERPLWDVLMLLMLAAVTLLCGVGTYLGFKRLLS